MKLSKLTAKTKMRHVAGTEVPRQNVTSVAMRKAMVDAQKAGWAGDEGNVEVDGGNAKPRLDRPGRKAGGALTSKERDDLPAKDFALPGRRYPVEDKPHARNALARVSQHGTPAEKAKVRKKVHAKFPSIGKD